nr:PREDICTED: saccharopine dehydrogenase-like oxidoreductase [Bemisia tabaci]
MAENRPIDILVLGATGFTGQRVVAKLVEIAKQHGQIRWGVAGRNLEKLRAVLKEAAKKTGENLENIPIVIADVTDEKSLADMASKTKVVINVCGPYAFYGEPVVKACINSGTHHLDVSGEPLYMESVQLKYHASADEKGVYVITGCGLSGVPADVGTIFLRKQFDGALNSVEIFLSAEEQPSSEKNKSSAIGHYATWESAVNGLPLAKELKAVRSRLFSKKMPVHKPRLESRFPIHKNALVGGKWCLPMKGADKSIVVRSQRYLHELYREIPAQADVHVAIRDFVSMSILVFFALIFMLLAKFSIGRSLLLKYPKIFSRGCFSHEGPTEEAQKNSVVSFTFFGRGWSQKTGPAATLPDKTVTTRLVLRSPGYGFTATSIILCAMTILEESENMPLRGGVYPPGAAFAKTSLIEKLDRHGVHFEVIRST